MVIELNLLDDRSDLPVSANHKGLAVGVFALRNPVSRPDSLVGVDQERGGQAKLVAKRYMAFSRVVANAKAGDAVLVNRRLAVTQRAKLFGSTWCIVLRIED